MANPKITINMTVVETPEEGKFLVVGQTVFDLVGAPNEEVEVEVVLKNGTNQLVKYHVLPLYPATNPPQPPALVVSNLLEGWALTVGASGTHTLSVLVNPALSPGATPSLDVEFVVE